MDLLIKFLRNKNTFYHSNYEMIKLIAFSKMELTSFSIFILCERIPFIRLYDSCECGSLPLNYADWSVVE